MFEVAAGTHTLTTLAIFDHPGNGQNPFGGLIMDASGNLYGTTAFGGSASGTGGDGTVFKLANNANHTLTTLATFNRMNGARSYAGLIADASGNMYGTTGNGGANDDGIVFKVANDANHTLTTLATFDGTNGSSPVAGLIADASGDLYGTTRDGGANGDGIVFKVANDANHTLTTLATFDGTNGSSPVAGLIADASGDLYGTTRDGGANGDGTVFELSPVPEPSTLVLGSLALGAWPLLAARLRKRAG